MEPEKIWMTGFFRTCVALFSSVFFILVFFFLTVSSTLNINVTEFWKCQFFVTGTTFSGVYFNYIQFQKDTLFPYEFKFRSLVGPSDGLFSCVLTTTAFLSHPESPLIRCGPYYVYIKKSPRMCQREPMRASPYSSFGRSKTEMHFMGEDYRGRLLSFNISNTGWEEP